MKTQHSVAWGQHHCLDANIGSLQREAGWDSSVGLEVPECSVRQDSWFATGSDGTRGVATTIGLCLEWKALSQLDPPLDLGPRSWAHPACYQEEHQVPYLP